MSSDCAADKACIRNKCADPCPGVCGNNAQCVVFNHVPSCTCINGHIGDPFRGCIQQEEEIIKPKLPENPCVPSPCGPNSNCRITNGLAVCSCAVEYFGSPPNCRPECTVNAECGQNKACHKFKCTNPCRGTCGVNANCAVINHNPICSCANEMTGDPFIRCQTIQRIEPETTPSNPCIPSPCGLYSECRVSGNSYACSCQANYIGTPPNCRPECVVNTDCSSDLSCIAEKCRDPCQGSCGFNTDCRVQNHIAICSCSNDFTGDPFTQCFQIVEQPPPKEADDPCNPSPCGPNANCENGICKCLDQYFGDPYSGCRPECTTNNECSPTKACINNKCADPCVGVCGQLARCDVINHIPTCSCPSPLSGDPFILCKEVKEIIPRDPCNPSPCGNNAVCRVANNAAICTCQQGMIGTPPSCRPECLVSADCSLQKSCLNKKCIDPCPGTCGQNAKCQVINHNPICSCMPRFTGDPFTRCNPIEIYDTREENPCTPNPCGPNSICKQFGDTPSCTCIQNYIGIPPNCRPECNINSECSSSLACINLKCRDPCSGSCGPNAKCTVINHTPSCSCEIGFNGDPFSGCSIIQGMLVI